MKAKSNIDVQAHLPHRAPMLMVDHVVEIQDKTIIAEKILTPQEPCFEGHFPNMPIFPGVLMVDAMAQAAGIFMHVSMDTRPDTNNPFYLASIKQARFKRLVVPGDTLTMHVTLQKHRGPVWHFSGEGYVGDELAVQAEFVNMQGSPAE